MNESRYIKTTVTRLPKYKRTIPVRGAFEDGDVYFKCWNCGFVCNSNTDAVGDHTGVSTTGFVDLLYGVNNTQLILDSLHCDQSMMLEYGQDGETPVVYMTSHRSKVTNGCPFCGCMNYR